MAGDSRGCADWLNSTSLSVGWEMSTGYGAVAALWLGK